ncbi:MAG: hypothetical protein Q9170_004998 [Blastenia crenularia]
MVDLALSSVALAIFSRIKQHPSAATEASTRYSRLLRIVSEQIRQMILAGVDERTSDAYLLTTFLMGRYEAVTRHPTSCKERGSFDSLQNWSHHDGMMALLKIWHDKLGGPQPATSIVKQCRRGSMRSCLLRSHRIAGWMLDGSHFGEHDLELQFDSLFAHIVNFRHTCVTLQKEGKKSIDQVETLRRQACEIDEALHDWKSRLPDSLSYQLYTLEDQDSLPSKFCYSPTVYTFSDPSSALVWSHYFATRMLFSSTRLRIVEINRPSNSVDMNCERERLEYIAELQITADSLASTISSSLDRLSVEGEANREGQPISIILKADADVDGISRDGLVAWQVLHVPHLLRSHKFFFPRPTVFAREGFTRNGIVASAAEKAEKIRLSI